MIIGAIDRFDREKVSGWAVDVFNPDKPVVINVLASGELVACGETCHRRKDVASDVDAELAGFEISVPEDIRRTMRLTLQVDGSDFDFEGACVQADSASSPVNAQKEVFQFPHVLYRAEKPKAINFQFMIDLANQACRKGRPVFVMPPFIDWNIPLFQRPQHIASAMAELGAFVIYFSPTFTHDFGTDVIQIRDGLILCKQPNNFEYYIEHGPPSFIDLYSTNTINDDIIGRWKSYGHNIVYEFVDHIDPAISGEVGAKVALETFAKLRPSHVDLLVPTAQILYDEVSSRFPSDMIALSPNGVEVERFSAETGTSEMVDGIRKQHGDKPVVGYVGALANWLDFELIEEVAKLRPDITFVLTGPEYAGGESLPSGENIILTGPVAYPLVPSVMRAFDVSWIPFKPGNIAKSTSPLKLFEYFASGQPVIVNSDMRECTAFEEVFAASSADEYAEAIDKALHARTQPAYQKALETYAQEASWLERAQIMLDAFNDVGPRKLAMAFPSHLPQSCISAGEGRLQEAGQMNIDSVVSRSRSGFEITSARPVNIVGEYKFFSVDLTGLGLENKTDWTLVLCVASDNAPPPRVSALEVLVDGEVIGSPDGTVLRYPVEVRLNDKAAAAKRVTLRVRAVRIDARRYWDDFRPVLKDAMVLNWPMKEDLVISASKSLAEERVAS